MLLVLVPDTQRQVRNCEVCELCIRTIRWQEILYVHNYWTNSAQNCKCCKTCLCITNCFYVHL